MLAAAAVVTGLWAGIDPSYSERLVVYHVNPLKESAIPTNMDTGDTLGDLYFLLQSPLLPLECANISNSSSGGFNPAQFDCNNPEKVDPDLMANKVLFEVDNRTTGYSGCNLCTNGTDPIGRGPCTIGEYVCDCMNFYDPLATCDPNRLGAESISGHYAKKHHCNASDPNWDCWRGNVARKTGGYWYSTLKDGQCTNDSETGSCGWRVVEEPLRIKKTCLDNAVFTTVEEAGPDCFKTCDGGKRNTTDPCWITCLYNTLLGPLAANSSVVTGMPVQPLVDAWEDSFKAGSRWNCVA